MNAEDQSSSMRAMNIPGRGMVEIFDMSQSYGGTIYGTTPGGTRIVYTRDMLMNCRNSPLSKTPPVNLPEIPGVTIGTPVEGCDGDDDDDDDDEDEEMTSKLHTDDKPSMESDELFELDEK